MTPGDVSRIKKRTKVETIVESAEDDEILPLPDEQNQRVCRGRKASELANTKLKEASLRSKLRPPSHCISKSNHTFAISSGALPSKRARKRKSNVSKADASTSTAESSFASTLDSLKPIKHTRGKVRRMETDDNGYVLIEEVQATKLLTHSNFKKKLCLREKTVTETQSNKRITKPCIKTVVDNAASSNVKSKASTRQHAVDVFSDSSGFDSEDDNIPIINFVSSVSKASTGPLRNTEQKFDTNSTTAGNDVGLKRLVIKLHRCDAKTFQSANRSDLKRLAIKLHRCDAKTFQSANRSDLKRPAIKLHRCDAKTFQSANRSDLKRPAIKLHRCDAKTFQSANRLELKRLVIKLHRCDSKTLRSPNCTDTTESKEKDSGSSKNVTATKIDADKCGKDAAGLKLYVRATAKKSSLADAPVTEGPAEKTLENAKPKAMNNAKNCYIPEPFRILVNQCFETVSVKKQMKALEKVLIVKSDVSARMTRTKVGAMMASLSAVTSLPEMRATKKINTSPSRNATNNCLSQSIPSTMKESTSKQPLSTSLRNAPNPGSSQSICSTTLKNRKTPHSDVHSSCLLAQMSAAKQSLVNLNANLAIILPKIKVLVDAEEVTEKLEEEQSYQRENKGDALLQKKALIECRTELLRKKREEKERNILSQKALKEHEKENLKQFGEKGSKKKARLEKEREEKTKITHKKEVAKLKSANIKENRARKAQEDAERMYKPKERKAKEAALKDSAMKPEKQRQAKKESKSLGAMFKIVKPVLVASSKYDYPLPDLSQGNESDFSEADEETIPSWATRDALLKNLKTLSSIQLKAMLCYFGSKPTSDRKGLFPNGRKKRNRTFSVVEKS